jgi:DNA-binding response OmpR family regulator
VRPRQDSNLRIRLRRPTLYPLSYEGGAAIVRTMDAVPTVLVVDDDPVIQKLLQVNFEMEGYDVVIAGDGEEGLSLAREERPDLVLLDVMMPKMNGLDVAAALRADELTEGIPIIMLSAKAQASDVQAGLDLGVNDYVTKPFDPLELLDRVGALLAR